MQPVRGHQASAPVFLLQTRKFKQPYNLRVFAVIAVLQKTRHIV